MRIKFESGQCMANNALEALRFAGRTGFLSRLTWDRFFARGTPRWHRRQLEKLVVKGYLKPHPNPQGHGFFILTDKARELFAQHSWSYVRPTPVGQLGHDQVVANSVLALDGAGILQGWAGERELARDRNQAYALNKRDQVTKYPDALLHIQAFGKPMLVAFEYERQRKAASRYQVMFRAYAGMSDLSMILFVCQNVTIRKAIERALKPFVQTPLAGRVAFADAEEWISAPLRAGISIRSGTIQLGDVCSVTDTKSVA